MGPGSVHQADDVLLHQDIRVYVAHRLLQREDVVRLADLVQLGDRVAVSLALHDRLLVLDRGIPQLEAEQEAVELRLRERERSFVLDRVLGAHHHERRRCVMRDPVHRYLALLHRLQQRRLCFWGRTVYFVGEYDLRKHRPGPKLEVASALVVHRDAGHVSRQEVRRELNAVERAAARASQTAGKHRLADARNVFNQQVPATHQRHHREFHLRAFANDDALYVLDDSLGYRASVQVGRFSGLVLTSKRQGGRFGSASLPLLRLLATPKGWQ